METLLPPGQENETSDLGRGLNFLLHCAGRMELPGAMAQDRNYPSNNFLCFSPPPPRIPASQHVAQGDAARQLHKPAHFSELLREGHGGSFSSISVLSTLSPKALSFALSQAPFPTVQLLVLLVADFQAGLTHMVWLFSFSSPNSFSGFTACWPCGFFFETMINFSSSFYVNPFLNSFISQTKNPKKNLQCP